MDNYFRENDFSGSADQQQTVATMLLLEVDLSRRSFQEFPEDQHAVPHRPEVVQRLLLHHNAISIIPSQIAFYSNLIYLDVSNNHLSHIADEISSLQHLQTLVAKNNSLDDDSLPKTLDQLKSLKTINLGGNNLTEFPASLVWLPEITTLHLASNKIRNIPDSIDNLQRLEVLNMGDNLLDFIPAAVGSLASLSVLNLACNRLRSLPKTLIHLRKLKSLSLHNNKIATLPPEIVSIGLEELSLRNNPLVVSFIRSMTYEVPSLMELTGRAIKLSHIPYKQTNLPRCLTQYLESANKCVNPRCKGVYFSAKVEHVKFVDFCGKYRLPLLQYLCSPSCSDKRPWVEGSSDSESDEELAEARRRIKRVLLG